MTRSEEFFRGQCGTVSETCWWVKKIQVAEGGQLSLHLKLVALCVCVCVCEKSQAWPSLLEGLSASGTTRRCQHSEVRATPPRTGGNPAFCTEPLSIKNLPFFQFFHSLAGNIIIGSRADFQLAQFEVEFGDC